MDFWTYLPQLFISGITIGAIYALVALGFVTISRASQIINFAQGEFVMLGGVITIFLSSTGGLVFGTLPKALPPFSGERPLQLWEVSVLPQSIWVLLSTFILLILLYFLSHRTLLGKAMEASSTDPLGADLLGISRNLMVFLAFGVSAGVGAAAGILITPIFFTSYSSGTLLGLKGSM